MCPYTSLADSIYEAHAPAVNQCPHRWKTSHVCDSYDAAWLAGQSVSQSVSPSRSPLVRETRSRYTTGLLDLFVSLFQQPISPSQMWPSILLVLCKKTAEQFVYTEIIDCDVVNFVARQGVYVRRMLSPIGRNSLFCCRRFGVRLSAIAHK